MADPDTPQELVIFQCAFVLTGEGAQKRPRLLILSAPTVEGVDTTKIAERWIQAVKAQGAFPVVNNLLDGTGFEVALPDPKQALVDKPAPMVRVNSDHPVFKDRAADVAVADAVMAGQIEVVHGKPD